LDFGPQPPSNRFFARDEPPSDAHDLTLGCCSICGLVQLIRPMPETMVRARHSWISYSEPEGHLDALSDDLIRLTVMTPDARILGLSHLDDTTLARFNRRGFNDTYRLDAATDLGIEDPLAGLETLQRAITPTRAEQLVRRHGQADVLLVRHVLEHAHAPREFLQALALLVRPGGCLVLEMPDSSKFLSACDYSFLWEEHVCYFTAATAHRLVKQAGLDPWHVLSYSYPLEDALIIVARPQLRQGTREPMSAVENERASAYGRRFADMHTRLRADLSRHRREGRRVSVFGAGHQAITFLNLFGLKDLIHCVIDDNPHKMGLCVPGSGLPVYPSSALSSENIDLCLLSLSPSSEKSVTLASKNFMARGGLFRSIFTLSPISYWEGLQ